LCLLADELLNIKANYKWACKMDVLIDLLPSANRVQTESSKKDKRQRNKYSRQMTSSKSNIGRDNDSEQSLNGATLKQVFWTGPDRRLSVERRLLKNQRGRWLESRERKDRRANAYAISVKI
jgi:hypothetical protein